MTRFLVVETRHDIPDRRGLPTRKVDGYRTPGTAVMQLASLATTYSHDGYDLVPATGGFDLWINDRLVGSIAIELDPAARPQVVMSTEELLEREG